MNMKKAKTNRIKHVKRKRIDAFGISKGLAPFERDHDDHEFKPSSKQKIVQIEKGNRIEFVEIGDISEAMGIAKGVSKKGLRDESQRFA